MMIVRRSLLLMTGVSMLMLGGSSGCQTTTRQHLDPQDRVRNVRCLFTNDPWLNLDKLGDRDPEGIEYRVFLETAIGKTVLRDGMLHIEMYRIEQLPDGRTERTLASDWHYPMSTFNPVDSTILGPGYLLRLNWKEKALVGIEAEFVTTYEDPLGNRVRGATKRFRIPKYKS